MNVSWTFSYLKQYNIFENKFLIHFMVQIFSIDCNISLSLGCARSEFFTLCYILGRLPCRPAHWSVTGCNFTLHLSLFLQQIINYCGFHSRQIWSCTQVTRAILIYSTKKVCIFARVNADVRNNEAGAADSHRSTERSCRGICAACNQCIKFIDWKELLK